MVEGIAPNAQLKGRRIIERPRLIRLLDESPERIKLLVAPAGYGKTTLARQWLEERHSVWYRISDASRDVAALGAGLQTAASAACAGAGEALLQRLKVTARPGEEAATLGTMLAEDLRDWPKDAWLVVDDYEAIAGIDSSERFVETLITEAPINLMILTRHRPQWASSRRIVYGDLLELDRVTLAMTDAEARDLLQWAPREAASVIELARGWPAVLSLAAASGATPPDLLAAPHLFEFFAEEVYSRIDAATQRHLATIALFESHGRQLAVASLSREVRQRLIATGTASGLLTTDQTSGIDIHPLLRSFLERKLIEEGAPEARRVVSGGVRRLIAAGYWDEAYALIVRFDQFELLPQLIEAARGDMLERGRTHTLEVWLAHASPESPPIQLAKAELALRAGRYYEAEALARLAAADERADFKAAALLVAGRAAHVASREAEALAYYEGALAVEASSELLLRAELGAVQAAFELEDVRAHSRLLGLEERVPPDPDSEVLIADRRLGVETRFCLPVDIARGRAAQQLLPLVKDPMIRTSFRNVFGYALAAMFLFDEALALTEEQIVDAERFRLDFVLPYAQTVRALVQTGKRLYLEAEESLAEVDERASRTGDQAVKNISLPIRARLYIAQGTFEAAASLPATLPKPVTKSLAAEYVACRALALAGVGQLREAGELATQALESSIGTEAQIAGNAALGVIALRRNDSNAAKAHATLALERASTSQLVECLVSALRGFPDLVVCILDCPEARLDLDAIIRISGMVAGVPHEQTSSTSVLHLSPREREVLALLASGMTNVQIGKALFISPVTVKVHVRHIFEKLGVRSRAEAALRAGQLTR